MRLFGGERVMGMMEKWGVDEDTPIEQKVLSNAIESAQKKIESRNFQSRKNTLEFDDVMNTQRALIYEQRKQVLDGDGPARTASQKHDSHLHRRNHVSLLRRSQRLCNAKPYSPDDAARPILGLFLAKDTFSEFTDQELEEHGARQES